MHSIFVCALFLIGLGIASAQTPETPYTNGAPVSPSNPLPTIQVNPAGQPAGTVAAPTVTVIVGPVPGSCPANPLTKKIPPLC